MNASKVTRLKRCLRRFTCLTEVQPLGGRTPEELWSGRQPGIKRLRVFGSKVLAYVPREKRDKWDSKAQELLFIGYDENIKGYRLIRPKDKEDNCK